MEFSSHFFISDPIFDLDISNCSHKCPLKFLYSSQLEFSTSCYVFWSFCRGFWFDGIFDLNTSVDKIHSKNGWLLNSFWPLKVLVRPCLMKFCPNHFAKGSRFMKNSIRTADSRWLIFESLHVCVGADENRQILISFWSLKAFYSLPSLLFLQNWLAKSPNVPKNIFEQLSLTQRNEKLRLFTFAHRRPKTELPDIFLAFFNHKNEKFKKFYYIKKSKKYL